MPASLMLNCALLDGEGKFLQMKSQKVWYSKRVLSLPTIPEISPTQKVSSETCTQPFKSDPTDQIVSWKQNCFINCRKKIPHWLTHRGCSWALSCNYDQCNKNRSIRAAAHLFIKLKSLSCTGCCRAVTSHVQSSTAEQWEWNDPRCALSTVLGCTPLLAPGRAAPLRLRLRSTTDISPSSPACRTMEKCQVKNSPADTWLVQVWC